MIPWTLLGLGIRGGGRCGRAMVGGALISGGGSAAGLGRITGAGGQRHDEGDEQAGQDKFFHKGNFLVIANLRCELKRLVATCYGV